MTPEDVRTLRQAQRAPPAIMAVAFGGKVRQLPTTYGCTQAVTQKQPRGGAMWCLVKAT